MPAFNVHRHVFPSCCAEKVEELHITVVGIASPGNAVRYAWSVGLVRQHNIFLMHPGIEVACNLLDVAVSPTGAVAATVQEHADRHGITVGRGYMTGKTPEELCSLAEQALADQTLK